jgi:hypothetical protein
MGTITAPVTQLDDLARREPADRADTYAAILRDLASDSWEEVATALWAGPLHDPDLAIEAWCSLTRPLPDGVALARILDVSGPVPAAYKQPVLEALATDPGWHDSVIRALWFATFEDHGDLDVAAARPLAQALQPRMAVSEYEDLIAALEQLPDDARSWLDWCERRGAGGAEAPRRPHFASARAATELERRTAERRRLDVGPPAGVADRRVTPDRRGRTID